MNVEWVQLGDALEMRRTSTNVDPGATYRPVGVRAFGRGVFDYPPTKGADLSKVRYFDLPAASLVVSNIKGWEGAVAVTGSTERGRIASSRFLTYQPRAKVDTSYVRHWLLSDGGLEVLDRCSPGSADRNRTLSRKGLEASLVPLPPIDEQRRIAAHLDSLKEVSDASRAGRAVNLPLEHSVVRSAARVGVATRVGDILKLDRPWIDLEEDVLYSAIGVRGFGRGLIVYPPSTSRGLSKMRYFGVRPERLVVSNIKAWEGAVTRTDGRHASLVGSNRFLQYEVTSGEVLLDWVQAYFASPQGTEALAAASPGSADRNRTLSIKTFEEIAIPVPSLSVQTEATALISQARQVARLAARAATVAGALLPAARNEIFTAMR